MMRSVTFGQLNPKHQTYLSHLKSQTGTTPAKTIQDPYRLNPRPTQSLQGPPDEQLKLMQGHLETVMTQDQPDIVILNELFQANQRLKKDILANRRNSAMSKLERQKRYDVPLGRMRGVIRDEVKAQAEAMSLNEAVSTLEALHADETKAHYDIAWPIINQALKKLPVETSRTIRKAMGEY